MSAEFIDMQAHRDRVSAPPAAARVVLSRLPRGASPIGGGALSLKFVLEGEERYRIDGRTYRVDPGQLLIIDPARTGEVTLPSAATGLCLYLPQVANAPARSTDLLLDGPVTLAAARHPLGTLLTAVARRLATQPGAGKELADRIVRRASARLSQLMADNDHRLDGLDAVRPATRRELLRRVEVARAWLHAHSDRPVSLGELAAQSGTSAFHLARAFAAVHGAAPATYHRNLRLDAVARALRSGAVAPAEAAVRLGFADQAGFTRAFKRRHGVTPGALSRRAG